ncbi:immunity protein YezG family protein [Anaerospora hongkongensis]|uniref:immunity protein YezG family protein n=1 Tax=Anaerospora hongkongensis TaxID=244830 RepID=UPI00289F325B|nr:immunity protein YezG family protein [Anaerospora hongkongensis]
MKQLYQKVVNILNKMVPEEWEKIHLYAEVREGYASVFFYYYLVGGITPIHSLDITDRFIVDDDYFSDIEHQLYNTFRELLLEFKLQGQEVWTNLTLILHSDGNFKINYEYEDVSQISPVEKKEKWKAKYLSL